MERTSGGRALADLVKRTQIGWWPLAVFVVLGLGILVDLVAPSVGEISSPLLLMIGHATAGTVILRKQRRLEGRERRAWRLVGIGLSLAAIGVLVVAVNTAMHPEAAAAFGPFDLIFITAYGSTLTGFALLPHLDGDLAHRSRLLLDGLVGGISLGTLVWVGSVKDLVYRLDDAPLWDRIAGTAYPLIDLAAFVVVIIVVVRRSAFRFDVRLLAVAAAFWLQSIADIAYLKKGAGGTFAEADPMFPLFLLASAAFLAAGVLLDRQPRAREYADRKIALVWILAPYVPAVLMVGMLLVEITDASFDSNLQTLLLATLITFALVVARQAVAIRENRELVERQRTALVSSISHELRTPLTAMVGFLNVLDDDDAAVALPPAERRDMLRLVREQSTYLTRIVTDLVMLARGDIDRMQLQIRPVDVTELLVSSVATTDGSTDDVVIDSPEGLIADVDRDRVRQVLLNLLSNAARYGGDRRRVVARRDGVDLVVEVHDNGPGVPKKFEYVIWERFERGPHRLNASVPGSGIGLAVVDAIARAHGGTAVYRRSEILGGSCFAVIFPASLRPVEPQEPEWVSSPLAAELG